MYKPPALAAICSILLSGFSFTSCIQSESEVMSGEIARQSPVDFDLDKIKERDTLRAIVDNSTSSYFVYKGQPMGYEYELLNLLAENLGVGLALIVTTDIEDALDKLNSGVGDIVAFNLTVTKKRTQKVAFTEHLSISRQVLVQKKPDQWRQMKLHEIEKLLVRDPIDLIGKQVHVRKSSSFVGRLKNLSEEMGGDIIIVEEPGDIKVENLIHQVNEGAVQFTVADENIAKLNATYYDNLDVQTAVSFSQRVAWAVRKNSHELLKATDSWLKDMKKDVAYHTIYQRYFESPKASLRRAQSDYSNISGRQISPYDDMIKMAARELHWDWELLAALIFQESKFDPKADSWAGAKGLMQLMPDTAKEFGAEDPEDALQSISAGVRYLKWLDQFWLNRVPDAQERIKFVLASYNVGQGHVLDARKLTVKHGKDSTIWDDNVAYYLLKKSEPEYYRDPVVTSGYCRGHEAVNYVSEILFRTEQYKQFMSGQPVISGL